MDFFADLCFWAAGLFHGFCHFCGKKCQEKSSRKIPSKILQNLYNKNPRHISAEGPGQPFMLRFVCPRNTTREMDGIAAKLWQCGIASEALLQNMPLRSRYVVVLCSCVCITASLNARFIRSDKLQRESSPEMFDFSSRIVHRKMLRIFPNHMGGFVVHCYFRKGDL